MDNLKKYKNAFKKVFNVDESDLDSLKYRDIEEWNSAGHFILVTELEDTFNIKFSIEDMIKFDSFKKGIELLEKYGIKMK